MPRVGSCPREGSSRSYAKRKIEAVGRTPQGLGGTCTSFGAEPNATIRITGTIDVCGVTVTN